MRFGFVVSLACCGLVSCFNPDAKSSADTDSTDSATETSPGSGTSEQTNTSTMGTQSSGTQPTGTGEPADCPGGAGCPCDGGCDPELSCVLDVCTDCGNGTVEHTEQCDGEVAGGQCAGCLVTCNETHDDCDGDPATCEDLQTTAEHCGACGHGCLGAGCSGGLCEPIALADNLGQPLGIVVEGDEVYWADQSTGGSSSGRILRTSTEPGGEIEVLADNQGNPERLVLTDTHVYWGNTSTGGIFRVARDGTGLEEFVPNEAAPKRLTVVEVGQNAVLIWTRYVSAGAVVRAPLATGTPTVVVGGQPFAAGLQTADGMLYWTSRDDGAVRRLEMGADPVVVEDLATAQDNPFSVVVDEGTIYWVNEGTQGAAYLDGAVWSMPVEGGEPMLLAEGEARPFELVVDASHLYWVSRVPQGAVRRLDKTTMEVSDLVPEAAQPGGIAQDQTAIYYTEQGAGRLLKVAK